MASLLSRRAMASLHQVASTSFNRRLATIAVANDECAKPKTEHLPTKLFVSVLIERLPLITTYLTPMETEYSAMCDMIDLETSYVNDDEVWRREHAANLKSDSFKAAIDKASGEKVLTPDDIDDAQAAKRDAFHAAPRVTEADTANDVHSLERALQRRLVLVTRNTFARGADFEGSWGLPQAAWRQGETLRQTADRVVASILPHSPCRILGNAPMQSNSYTLPPATAQAIGGEAEHHTHFFYKAHLEHPPRRDYGGVTVGEAYPMSEHRWLTHDEVIALLRECHYDEMAAKLVKILHE